MIFKKSVGFLLVVWRCLEYAQAAPDDERVTFNGKLLPISSTFVERILANQVTEDISEAINRDNWVQDSIPTLERLDGTVLETKRTWLDADGFYHFNDLPIGSIWRHYVYHPFWSYGEAKVQVNQDGSIEWGPYGLFGSMNIEPSISEKDSVNNKGEILHFTGSPAATLRSYHNAEPSFTPLTLLQNPMMMAPIAILVVSYFVQQMDVDPEEKAALFDNGETQYISPVTLGLGLPILRRDDESNDELDDGQ